MTISSCKKLRRLLRLRVDYGQGEDDRQEGQRVHWDVAGEELLLVNEVAQHLVEDTVDVTLTVGEGRSEVGGPKDMFHGSLQLRARGDDEVRSDDGASVVT